MVGARCFVPYIGHAQRAPTFKAGPKNIVGAIHELPLRADRNGKVEGQSRFEGDKRFFKNTIFLTEKGYGYA
jgi:hypothetical protein